MKQAEITPDLQRIRSRLENEDHSVKSSMLTLSTPASLRRKGIPVLTETLGKVDFQNVSPGNSDPI